MDDVGRALLMTRHHSLQHRRQNPINPPESYRMCPIHDLVPWNPSGLEGRSQGPLAAPIARAIAASGVQDARCRCSVISGRTHAAGRSRR